MKPSLLIIGLGNIGNEYAKTRHNVGFDAIDVLQKNIGTTEWKDTPKFKAITAEARINTFPVLLVKPTTYMNRSGESVQKLVDFYKLDPEKQVLIMYDDIDIPLGDLRFREKGSAGTHNGAKSLIASLGTAAISRLRIGIGPKPTDRDLAQWVLSSLSKTEQTQLDEVYTQLQPKIEEYAYAVQE